MRHLIFAVGVIAVALPASAQPNPFKLPKASAKSAEVSYAMSGDMTGTATTAFDGDRMVHRQNSTMKMMGKSTTIDSWTLTTPDSTYMVDLVKKKGTVAPNMLPSMAKAYDDLDGAGKKRLHQNMEDMGSMMSKVFNLSSLNSGEKLGTKTYAGQECEERKFSGFEVCTMTKAPIMLHTKASIACLSYEETATDVKLGSSSPAAFAAPAGIVFQPNPNVRDADSTAKGFVNYLASQELADSIAKGKAEMEAAQAKAGASGQPTKLTPEQQASMQQACEMMKNMDVGKMVSDASNQFMKNLGEQAKQAAVDAAKNEATNKVKSIFKKPKIPLR